METRKGIITAIEKSDGEKNGKKWERYCFTIDGKKYSTFDTELGSNFKIKDYVEMTGEQQGKYWNMSGMKKIDGSVESQKEAQKKIPQEQLKSDKNEDLLRLILGELGNAVTVLKIMNKLFVDYSKS